MIDVSDLMYQPYTKEHDCNWLASEVAKRGPFGFPEGLTTPTDDSTWADMFKEVLQKHYRKVDAPLEGHIAIFEIPDGKKTGWHCGTIIKPGWFITTRETVGVHMARLNSVLWRTTLKGFYEFVN